MLRSIAGCKAKEAATQTPPHEAEETVRQSGQAPVWYQHRKAARNITSSRFLQQEYCCGNRDGVM